MAYIEDRGNGKYRLTVYNGFDAEGKRNRERKPITVDPELLKSPRKLANYLNTELAKFQMEVENGEYVKPNRMTFKEFVEVWKENYAAGNLGGRTRKNYYAQIDAQLIPEFGHKILNEIKTIHIVKYMTKLKTPEGRKDKRKKPLATNTLLNIYNLLKSIFDHAVQWKFIAEKNNPMTGVKRPKADRQEKREMKQRKMAYSTEEAKKVILALCEEPRHWSLYFIGVILGGFRRGEMLAVQWTNVDFINGGLWIEKQITFDEEGEVVEDEVKTEESVGFVPMPGFYMNELKTYQAEWNEDKAKAEEKGSWEEAEKQYLFHPGNGKALYPDAPTLKWSRLRSKLNLPAIRLHDLRHTTAMLLREENVDMKTIQERLRHARLETTSKFYTHKSEKISRVAADKLEKFNPALLGSERGENTEKTLQNMVEDEQPNRV
ncbi:site-specific integrase [Paenibacillus sp. YN15]|uniref:tyrosine-type recombinase/integrase n=1 Tax=Paenibacillus sp. YN15 TaxID=1742774 RepID=UPI000DCB4793|nr:site-specific integrase [Paenibacillus sp. YN15]RAU92480.1 site-specific integrase [Paenibacillus sp. YN15]